MVKKYSIVVDTNVFITALRSKKGASYKLIFDTNREMFEQNLSTTLLYEYESIAKQKSQNIALTEQQIDAILNMICHWSNKCRMFYVWRPFLKDPDDDMVLELAIESQSEFIISYNKKDFVGVEQFGLKVLTPKEFLIKIGEISS